MAATILEIARRLNLSHATVSRVLNGKPGTPVAVETRRRVVHAAQEMGYRPNLAARSMRDSRSNLVAVFASPHAGVWAGIAPCIVKAIAPVLHERGMELFFAFSMDQKEEMPAGLPPWRYDAAVLLQQPPAAVLEQVLASRRPCIAVNELVPGIPCVLGDEEDGVSKAIGYLHGLGHRRIAYANASNDNHFAHYSVEERQAAYVKAMCERELTPLPGYEERPRDRERVGSIRHFFMEERATAVLAYDHMVALDVISAADVLGLRIPEEISLVSFNDAFPLERMNPPVTVVDPSGEEIGRVAAERLLEIQDGVVSERPTIDRIRMRLTIRGSAIQAQ